MKTVVITDNNELRNIIINSDNDYKIAYKKYKRPEEAFYSSNCSFMVTNGDTSHSDSFEASMFDDDASKFSVTINVRNKANTSVFIEDASLLVIDKRLNTSNYRDLDGIEKIPARKAQYDTVEIGYDSAFATVNDKQKHSIKTEYDKEDGITKGIMLECQSSSYFELMPVVESRIIGVVGLPPGMIFEYGKIKGSPSKSGDYRGLITLADGRTINLMIKVSRIRRMF